MRAAVADLIAERDGLRAARIAYASEFPDDAEGMPNVGSIHENIRKLKAERDALRDVLERIEMRCKEHPDDTDADRKRNLYHAYSMAKNARS